MCSSRKYPYPTTRRLTEILRGRGVFKSTTFLKESVTLNWYFCRGWGGKFQTKKPSIGGVWIFSGTTQLSKMASH